jgi:hypothetical protein
MRLGEARAASVQADRGCWLNSIGGPGLEMEGLPVTNHGVDNPVPLADDDLMLKISEDEAATETSLGCELEMHDHGTAGYYHEEHCRHGAATVVGNVGGPTQTQALNIDLLTRMTPRYDRA